MLNVNRQLCYALRKQKTRARAIRIGMIDNARQSFEFSWHFFTFISRSQTLALNLPVCEAVEQSNVTPVHPKCVDTGISSVDYGEPFVRQYIRNDQSITLKFGVNDS